jgi:uncharacterized protein (TIGR02001 family)
MATVAKLGLAAKVWGSLIAVALPISAKNAAAQGSWSGNASLTSDYTWRGISLSNGDPAIQGGFDYANSLFFAGVWASTIDFGDAYAADIEVSYYTGLAGELKNGVNWNVTATYFDYPDADAEELSGLALSGGLSYSFETGLWVGTEGAFSPGEDSVYASLQAGYALSSSLSLDAAIGSSASETEGDYADWSLGSTVSLGAAAIDLRYWDTDIVNFAPAAKRIVLTLSVSG